MFKVEIPSFPEVYYEFKEAIKDPDGSIDESSEIISTDTGLTVRLLKIVNSSFYAFPSQAARVIASHSKEINTERFFVAGMLHNVGSLVLAMSAPFSILSVFMRCKPEEIPLNKAQKNILGFSHTDVGQLLLKNWTLPVFHQNILGNHHQSGSSIDLESGILYVADHIANDLKLGDSGEGLSPPPLD